MSASNLFDGLEIVPIAQTTKAAIRQADEVMKAVNLPTYSDLLEGLAKFERRTSPGRSPVTVDWLVKHIAPLWPK